MNSFFRLFISMLLTAVLMCGCAMANEIPESTTPRENAEIPESITGIADAIKAQEATKAGLNLPTTTDVVTIGYDGTYNVMTNGLNISVYPPFGWYVLTQDLAAQYDMYAMLANSGLLADPASAANELITNGYHYLMVDPYYGTTIIVMVDIDGLSSFVTDSSALTSAEIETVKGIVASANAFPTSVFSTGTENFVKYDTRDVDGTVIYTAYRNGWCIDFYVIPATYDIDAELTNAEYMLCDVAISPAY